MKLILGGAYQGKTDFAKEKFNIVPKICTPDTALTAPCINCFHLLIKDLLNQKQNPLEYTRKLITENPNAVIICNEIGLGIVPLDKEARIWRESVGRCLCLLAKEADYVCRIFAGIETRIK